MDDSYKGDFTSYLDRLADFTKKRLGVGLGLSKEGDGWEGEGPNGLSMQQISAAVELLAVLHGTGIAYRRSHKDCSDNRLSDPFTIPQVRELVSHHLTPHLVQLGRLEGSLGVDHHLVTGLRTAQRELPRLIVSLRKSSDSYSTVCHGSPSSSSFTFQTLPDESVQCSLLPPHSSLSGSLLFPTSDLAHFLLTSCPSLLTPQFWQHTLSTYYTKLSQTVSQFGLILRHMGVNEAQFKAGAERALAGQWLVVTLVQPLLQGVRLDKGTARQLLKIAHELKLQLHWKTKARIKPMVSVNEEDEQEEEEEVKERNVTNYSETRVEEENEEGNESSETQIIQLCSHLVIEAKG